MREGPRRDILEAGLERRVEGGVRRVACERIVVFELGTGEGGGM